MFIDKKCYLNCDSYHLCLAHQLKCINSLMEEHNYEDYLSNIHVVNQQMAAPVDISDVINDDHLIHCLQQFSTDPILFGRIILFNISNLPGLTILLINLLSPDSKHFY